MDPLLRLVKSVVLALVTLASVWYLSGSALTGLLFALVPLIFGMLAIAENIGSGVAALSLVTAVAWASLPPETKVWVKQQAYELQRR